MSFRTVWLGFLATVILASQSPAQTNATADAILAAISGNTVRGSMSASGGYEEFYAADGTIRGADYTGKWTIKGNQMCFAYDGNPASCWSVRITGTSLVWVGVSGDEGSGSIVPGNPNNF